MMFWSSHTLSLIPCPHTPSPKNPDGLIGSDSCRLLPLHWFPEKYIYSLLLLPVGRLGRALGAG